MPACWADNRRRVGLCLRGKEPLPRPPQLYDILMEWAHALEAIVFQFRAGSIELLPGKSSNRPGGDRDERNPAPRSERPSLDVTIEVHAHTDAIGDEISTCG